MHKYKYIATVVLETLIEKIQGLDNNGIDLFFAFNPSKNLKLENSKLDAARKSRQRMMKAWPDTKTDRRLDLKTDMAAVLGRFFQKWIQQPTHPKAKTIIVLTDGNWAEGIRDEDFMKQDSVADKIVKFCQTRRVTLESRKFTIQFVRFGDDENVIKKLEKLDNKLTDYNIP
jgi:hypothetical protein